MRGSVAKSIEMPVMLAGLLTPYGEYSGTDGTVIVSVRLQLSLRGSLNTYETIELVVAIEPELLKDCPSVIQNAQRARLKAGSELNKTVSLEMVYRFVTGLAKDAIVSIPAKERKSLGEKKCEELEKGLRDKIAGVYADKVKKFEQRASPEEYLPSDLCIYAPYQLLAHESIDEIWTDQEEVS